jgi:pyruvate dehydrogenase E2 component (dihydrolipoamide acetyltransferase)
MLKEVKIPEIGENIETGDVAKVLVQEGDNINEGQGLLELETDKAVVEMPAPFAGTINEVKVSEGDTVYIGQVVFLVDTNDAADSSSEQPEVVEEVAEADTADVLPQAVEAVSEKEVGPAPEPPPAVTIPDIESPPPASPSVRRFAREIGVNIREVGGTGRRGRITTDDVKLYAKRRLTEPRSSLPGVVLQPTLPDFEKWGDVSREKFNKVRRITAKTMATAWSTIPQVTQFEKADITELEAFRESHAKQVEKAGGKLTVTAILIKVLSLALDDYSHFNSSIDMESNEYIHKSYHNIGIAAATSRGLLVPVMHNVHVKSITDVAIELSRLAEKAREGKLSIDEMEGATITISNQGPMGGEQFTPIVYPPQVAILGVSTSRVEPVWNGGEFEARTLMPLALSYDHRANDGADASAFLHFVCDSLRNPLALFL